MRPFAFICALAVVAPVLAGEPESSRASTAQAQMETVADMLDTALTEGCGADLLGQMVFTLPALAMTGSREQQAMQKAWLKGRLAGLRGKASDKLPEVVNTAACRALDARWQRLTYNEAFQQLVSEGMMSMAAEVKDASPK